MDYFKLFGIPLSFTLDEADLKRTFYRLSKEYHPDFHTDKSPEEQDRILALSSQVNEAYQTLKDADKRMKYILDQKGLLQEGKDQLPQAFLMEMMDVNEAIMELQFSPDPRKRSLLQHDIEQLKQRLQSQVDSILQSYTEDRENQENLAAIKNFYLKKRYILRIQENLRKFASA